MRECLQSVSARGITQLQTIRMRIPNEVRERKKAEVSDEMCRRMLHLCVCVGGGVGDSYWNHQLAGE